MNPKEEKINGNIWDEIEKSLTSNIYDILENDYYERERKKFMKTIDIDEIIQEEVQKEPNAKKGNLRNSTIGEVVEFQKAISKAKNGTILRIDKKVLEESIKGAILTHSPYDLGAVSDQWRQRILEVCEKQEDFLIAFYIVYIYLDDVHRNHAFSSILSIFNQFDQTNYQSLKDVLEKNNLKSIVELKEYVDVSLGDKRRNKSI